MSPPAAFPDRPGWVTTLVLGLEECLARKLGRVDSYDLWRDAKLAGHVELTPEILGRVRDAAVLLLVLSPAYLASEWCRRELAAFHEEIRRRKAARGRVFVVEFDRSTRTRSRPSWPISGDTASGSRTPTPGTPRPSATRSCARRTRSTTSGSTGFASELVRELECLRQHEQKTFDPGEEPRPSDHDASKQHEEHRNSVRRLLVPCLERLCRSKASEPVLRRVAETLEIEDFPDDQDRGIQVVADFLVDPAHNQAIPLLNSLIVALWGNKRSSGPADLLDECLCLILPLHFSRDAIDLAAVNSRAVPCRHPEDGDDRDWRGGPLGGPRPAQGGIPAERPEAPGKTRGRPRPARARRPVDRRRRLGVHRGRRRAGGLLPGPTTAPERSPHRRRPEGAVPRRLEALAWYKPDKKRTFYCVVRKPDNPADRDHALRVYEEVRKRIPLLPILVLDEDALARGDEGRSSASSSGGTQRPGIHRPVEARTE